MRGNSARECRTSLISPKNSTPESNPSLSQTRQPPRAAADGAASTKVDARRNAPTARFPIASPFPGGTPARCDVNRQPLPLSNPPTTACRSGRGSVHEGGRPAERPHGAISNRQPLPRRNARTARCQSPTPPSLKPANHRVPQRTGQRPRRRTPGGTPARRDFQSPAPSPAERPRGAMSIASPSPLTLANHRSPQRTGQRPRRWTPGGTPARRDVNRQPLPRRNARTVRCQSPAPPSVKPANHRVPQRTGQRPRRRTPGGTPARRDVNRQPFPSQGWIFRQAPVCHLPFQPSECPDSPFSPCGRRGQGG